MPKQLLDLPQDVLDRFWGHLLPPLNSDSPESSLYSLILIPNPFDLYNVMLTCKYLYGMAYPWVWRRVDVIETRRASRWRYLVEHPEAAVHVRLFMVGKIVGYETSGIGLILGAARLMQNIRVFIYHHGFSRVVSQIFDELISKPHLHTLSTCNPSTGSNVSAPRSLRRLICLSKVGPAWTLDSAPNLESFAVLGPWNFPSLSSLPWASLRDIEVCGTKNLTVVLDSFTAWKRTYPGTQSPLQEVTFHHSITVDAMYRIFDAFRGQNLTTLCFNDIPFLDASFIQGLVETFPHVRRLGLMTGDIVSAWPLELTDIVQMLGRLRVLAWLQWNYIGVGADFLRHDSTRLKTRFHQVSSALEDHCAPSLRRIDLREGNYIYTYERTEGQNFQRDECSKSRFVMLHNNSWHCDIYDRI